MMLPHETPAPCPQSVSVVLKNHPPSGCCRFCSRAPPLAIVADTVASSTRNPVPVKAIACGELIALVPIEKLAARGPAAVGENRNVKVQNAPGESPGPVSGQLVCPWKSPLPIVKVLAGAAPLNVANTSGPGPLFVMVTACEAMLVVPTRCLPNATVDADSAAERGRGRHRDRHRRRRGRRAPEVVDRSGGQRVTAGGHPDRGDAVRAGSISADQRGVGVELDPQDPVGVGGIRRDRHRRRCDKGRARQRARDGDRRATGWRPPHWPR